MTVYSGSSDLSKVGVIHNYKVEITSKFELDQACQALDATDGLIFHPFFMNKIKTHVFERILHRLMPLKYEQDIKSNPNTKRFTVPKDIFSSEQHEIGRMCYCSESHPCDPRGIFIDQSSYIDGMKLFLSAF